MTDESEKQCAHEQCQKSLKDLTPCRDMGNGRLYCSEEHLLAAANGNDLDD